jgi:hypothetical protein
MLLKEIHLLEIELDQLERPSDNYSLSLSLSLFSLLRGTALAEHVNATDQHSYHPEDNVLDCAVVLDQKLDAGLPLIPVFGVLPKNFIRISVS